VPNAAERLLERWALAREDLEKLTYPASFSGRTLALFVFSDQQPRAQRPFGWIMRRMIHSASN